MSHDNIMIYSDIEDKQKKITTAVVASMQHASIPSQRSVIRSRKLLRWSLRSNCMPKSVSADSNLSHA